MKTLGDYVQVALILLTVFVILRAIWNAIVRPRAHAHADQQQTISADPPRERWSIRGELARLFLISDAPAVMSNDRGMGIEEEDLAAPVAATAIAAGQPIAKPGNAVNEELPGNDVAALVPAEARDIIRMQAKAEAVAALLKSGRLTNKAEAIELIFACSRSGRAGSMYARALALVDPLLAPPGPTFTELDADKRPAVLSKAS